MGLVLAGGGARGAYEIGVLSRLLPALEERGYRPRVIVGTSVGALNAAYLASVADVPAGEVVENAKRIWTGIRFEDVVEPIASPGALARVGRYVGQFLGLRHRRLEALLDPSPLGDKINEVVQFDHIERNVDAGDLRAAAVVATSAASSRSVVFHRGGDPPERDDKRGIDYVAAALTDEHVLASAAIPTVFPAVDVTSPRRARGWYFDGGTRLNTPIKPALSLGAKRIVVIGLNSIARPPAQLAGEDRPDALEGFSQFVQAVLVDPLAHDVATLATVNELVGAGGGGKDLIRYVFVAPEERDAIGRRARDVFQRHYSHLADALLVRDLPFLGRAVSAGSDPLHGELLSYLFFAPQFAESLWELGRGDAERWLKGAHEDDIWETGPLGPNPVAR